MTNTKSVVQVNNIKKLIDLNGDKTNFDLSFNVKSLKGSPFDAIVVSQAQLDSGNPLEYKKVSQGIINGNIISDKNVYQNYFLLLKSDSPIECEVEVNIKEIPPKIEMANNNSPPVIMPTHPQDTSIEQRNKTPKQPSKSPFNLKKILLILVGIAGIGLVIWFLYKKKPSKELENSNIESSFNQPTYILDQPDYVPVEINNTIDSEMPSILENNYVPPSAQLDSGSESLNTKFDNKLFNRLNNIKIW
jgi:hypothetical protein